MIHNMTCKLYPDEKTKEFIKYTIDCARWVYNWSLEKIIDCCKNKTKWPSNYDIQLELTELKTKEGYEWLKVPDSQALNNVIDDLYCGLNLWKKGVSKFPKFKKKKDGYRTRGDKSQKKKNYFNLRKIGYVKCKGIKELPDHILNVTIKYKGDNFYLVICYEDDIDINEKREIITRAGIDVGVSVLATVADSDGNISTLSVRHPSDKEERKRRRLDRRMSRETRGSNNWNKNLIKLQRQYLKESNRRHDDYNKIVLDLTRKYDRIVIEDTHPSEWKVKGCHKFNKQIDHQAIGLFQKKLKNKCDEKGVTLIKANRKFASSQTCSSCHGINPKTKNVAVKIWTCDFCGTTHNRDENAAINLMNYGF